MQRHRRELSALIRVHGFKSLFDAPCGDFNWMPSVVAETQIGYAGGDIVQPLIDKNRAEHPGVRFNHFDITKNEFIPVDVWHCRDCLFHLSYRDIQRAFENFGRSEVPYALLTSHRLMRYRNRDIQSGDFRYLDLTQKPILLPRPMAWLTDYDERIDKVKRFVGLWDRASLKNAAEGMAKTLGRH